MKELIDVEVIGDRSCLPSSAEHEKLLSAVQAGESVYSDSLGWLDPDEWGGEDWLDKSIELAERARAIADTFVVIGIGGSNNSVRALLKAVGERCGMNIVYAGNTLSAYEYKKTAESLEGHDFVIDCIAKNFETLEPGLAFRIFRDLLARRYGKEGAAERIFCTGTVGSHFEKLARDNGYTFIPFPGDIGGRYTALSPVHLVPMAAGGADIRSFSQGAHDMARLLRTAGAADNPAFIYAVARNHFFSKGYRIEILSSFEPRFRWFYKWWEQLFAESEGKCDKGLFPVGLEFSEELHSLGQFIQDGSPVVFETFIDVKSAGASVPIPADGVDDKFSYLDGMTVESVNRVSQEATMKAHSSRCPCLRISIEDINEYTIGALMYFFEFSCYLSGSIMGINPFNQPGVEKYKMEMFSNLGK